MGGKKVSSMKLADVVPTSEELAEARAIIASASDPNKKQRATMASMTYWLKTHAADNAHAVLSQGEHRKQYLAQFLVFQSREKKAKLAHVTTRTVGQLSEAHTIKGWFSYEVLKGKVGQARLDTWIERKLIPSRPDSRTGSTDVTMQDYYYEEAFEDSIGIDHMTSQVTDSKEATEQSLEMLGSMADDAPETSGSSTDVVPALKQEVLSEEELMKQRCDLLHADAKPTLAKFQLFATDLKTMRNVASDHRYSAHFVSDVDKLIPKVNKSIRALEIITVCKVGKDFVSADTPKLLGILEKIEKEVHELINHGKRFGWAPAAATKGKKRKA